MMTTKEDMEILYQSDLWKEIQSSIYQKSTTEIELFWKSYFCIIKEKKIWPFLLKWYQIMGVILPDDEKYVKKELERIKKLLQKKRGVICLQLWLMNEITRFKNGKKLSEVFKEQVKNQRLILEKKIVETYGLKVAFRENMPVSNIIYDIQKTDEVLLEEMHDSCRTKVKKAMKKNILFKTLETEQEQESFYHDWKEISGKKHFGIIPEDQFIKLVTYLKKEHKGTVFVTELDGDIVGGSIVLFRGNTMTYLYGFGNRKYQNIGGHHFLKFKLFEYAREHWLKYVDAMGGAPTGFPEHHLKGVSDFKESLGWEKIEYYGNFDLVCNGFLYQVFKWYKKFQH